MLIITLSIPKLRLICKTWAWLTWLGSSIYIFLAELDYLDWARMEIGASMVKGELRLIHSFRFVAALRGLFDVVDSL